MDAHELNATRAWTVNYAPGVPADIPPVDRTLYHWLAERAEHLADSPATEFFGAGLTFAQLHDLVLRLAGALHRLGVTRGDRVALVMPNCPQHMIAYYAVLRLGAICVEHNPLYTREELLAQYRDHGATVTIAWNKIAPTVLSFASELPVSQVIAVDVTTAMPWQMRLKLKLPVRAAREARAKLTAPAPGATSFAALLKGEPVPSSVPGPELDEIAAFSYTSGTTGTPKGAILTNRNLIANGLQGQAWMPDFRPGNETIYSFLPLFHSFGLLLGTIYGAVSGSRVTLFPTFDPELIVAASAKHPATFIPGVPPMYDRLARVAGEGRLDLSGVHYAMSGAMTLSERTVERWEAVAGGRLTEGYGLTEASPFALANPFSDRRKVGTIGLPCPSTWIRITDADDPEVEVALGEVGELQIRGPQVFQGYWNNPEETAKVLLADGWLRTGDLVTQDADGFITVVDRKKELIITGGFNVSPSEVERALALVPGVAESAVVGLERGTSGAESITAVIVLEPGASWDEHAARKIVREHLSEHKVPRSYVVWEELPKSLIGKILRRQVRDTLRRDPKATRADRPDDADTPA